MVYTSNWVDLIDFFSCTFMLLISVGMMIIFHNLKARMSRMENVDSVAEMGSVQWGDKKEAKSLLVKGEAYAMKFRGRKWRNFYRNFID